jgi:phosphatidylglycerol:prolipoprotein diacylglycerol transferase
VHPELIHLGPWPLRSYGVALVLSFLLGTVLARHRARQLGLDPRLVAPLALLCVAATLVGARLLYVVTNLDEFAAQPLDVVRIYRDGRFWLDGLAMNGGVIACLLAMACFLRARRQPVLRMLDAIAPSFALGLLLTRIGCFLNGCCFGVATTLPWGVIFPAGSPAGAFQRLGGAAPPPVHPTQLYASGSGLAILFIALWLERRPSYFPGRTCFTVLLLYSAARFAEELVRHQGDAAAPWLALSYNQWITAAGALASAGALAWLSRRRPGKITANPGSSPGSPR